MSNHLAVATVTASLRRMLQGVVAADVNGATVTTVRPTESGAGLPQTGVNLFLYLVTPNPDLRPYDLPTRRADGTLQQRPQAAVDLHYLLSFYGEQSTLEPQRLLGSVVRLLHSRPILTRDMIRDTLADPAFSFIAGSDMADAPETVRLSPLGYSLQEMAQLWTGPFQKSEYVLSVAYRASVVLLTADERPSPALPVRAAQLVGRPARQPLLESVAAEGVAGAPAPPLVVGAAVRLTGQRLAARMVRVRVAGQEVEPSEVSDSVVRFTLGAPGLDPAGLRAGVTGVQIHHPFVEEGNPPEPRPGVESNVLPLVLRPQVLGVTAGAQSLEGSLAAATVTVDVEPPVGAGQRAALQLTTLPDPEGSAGPEGPHSYSFPVPPRDAAATQLLVPVAGIVPGAYLCSLQVDGAASPLTFDADPASASFGRFDGPAVEITGGRLRR